MDTSIDPSIVTPTNETAVPETATPDTVQKPESEPEKVKMTEEEEFEMLQGRLKRLSKKLGKDAPEKKQKEKSDKLLDYGELAFYNTKSDSVKIESDEDIDFLRQTIEDTGKQQRELLGAKWFQAELKERRDAKSALTATPSANRSSNEPAQSKVDWWIAQGKLPEDQKMREQVVNRKIELAKQGRNF